MNVNGCRWCVAMAVAALMTVSACRTQPKTTDQQTAATRDDAAISTSIESKFFADSTTKGSAIDVDTDNRVVTLTGNVPNVTVKQRAVEIAKSEEGVTRVEDRLVVATETAQAEPKPDVMPDAPQNPTWITTKIQAKYFVDNDVKGRNIDVSTSSTGQVTLRGSVDSDAVRQKAVNLARSTEGVTGVDDELRVAQPKRADRPTEEASKVAADAGDGWITAKIQSKYFLDPDVKGRNINVDTSSGVVTLSGHVESQDERRQAVQLAKGTDGVTDVRDQLQLKPTAARGEDATSKVAKNVNDIWIATKIQSKYFLDDDVKGLNIDVTAKSGVVTLEGKVSSAEEKKAAEALAKDTRGVSRVVNRLVVGTGQN